MLRIELDQAAGPAYQQIVDQVKAARASGVLRPGARLPTVRASHTGSSKRQDR